MRLRRFAKLEVGRIEQALLLVLVEQAFRRDELENIDARRATIRARSRPPRKLVLGLRQGDVQRRARPPPHRPSGIAWRWWSCRCRGCPRAGTGARAARPPAVMSSSPGTPRFALSIPSLTSISSVSGSRPTQVGPFAIPSTHANCGRPVSARTDGAGFIRGSTPLRLSSASSRRQLPGNPPPSCCPTS